VPSKHWAADDVTPPDFRLILNHRHWETTELDVSVIVSDVSELPAEMRLALSPEELRDAQWLPFTGFGSITIPGVEGQHFVYAQVRDAAGNESAVRASFVFLVDDAPPVSQAGPLDASYSTETVDVPYAASDDLSGVATIELWWRYRVDESGAWSDWTLGPTGTSSPIAFTFSSGDGLYEFYSVAIDHAGNRELAPAEADAATTFALAGATWSAAIRVNDDTGLTQQHRPSVAVGTDGDAYLVWDDYRSTDHPDIYFSRLETAGSEWSANEKVNDDATSQIHAFPDIAMDGSDNAFAVWQDYRPVGNKSAEANIYFARRTAATGSWGTNVRVNDDFKGPQNAQREPSIAADAAGNAVAVWVDRRNGRWDIYGAQIATGASNWQTNTRVSAAVDSRKFDPDVAVAPDGTAYAVWEDDRSGSFDIYYATLAPGSSGWSTDARLSDDPGAADQYSAQIAIDGAGNVHVAWIDDRVASSEVRVRRLIGGSSTWDPSQIVSDEGAYPGGLTIAASAGGSAFIAWSDARGASWDIWGADYVSGMGWLTAAIISDDPGNETQWSPTVATADDSLVVAWQDQRENYQGDIYALARQGRP
jgi:hypothetical protein